MTIDVAHSVGTDTSDNELHLDPTEALSRGRKRLALSRLRLFKACFAASPMAAA